MREVNVDDFKPNEDYNPPRLNWDKKYKSLEEVDLKELSEKVGFLFRAVIFHLIMR